MKDRRIWKMTQDISAEEQMVARALLSLPRPAPADRALRAAILAIPGHAPQTIPKASLPGNLLRWWPFGTILGGPVPQLGGLVFACLLGLVMGYTDIIINPWERAGLTEIALGLDTPQGLLSLEGGEGK
jgi:hypothetical protein